MTGHGGTERLKSIAISCSRLFHVRAICTLLLQQCGRTFIHGVQCRPVSAVFSTGCRRSRPRLELKQIMAEFTHLHLHTEYSLLDGACDVHKLVDRVAKLGQTSVAMTDHGNIYGAVHFFNAAKAKGIKPILGCELYISKKEDHRAPGEGDENNHLLVLAQNEEGYRNLIRITSEASLYGFYRKPRVSKKFLAEHSKGLIGFSGCLSGELCEHLVANEYEKARATAAQYRDIFGKENFYLEIQDQGLEQEKKIHEALFRLERELEIPM